MRGRHGAPRSLSSDRPGRARHRRRARHRTGDRARIRGDGRARGLRGALGVRCDVTDAAQLEDLARRTVSELGRLDILVNNAGGFPPMKFLDTDLPSWEWCFRFNLTSAFVLTRACLSHMLERDGGA